MFSLIIGGAASGKSEFAERYALKLPGRRIYLATMEPFGAEGCARVEKHRRLREGKGFETVERYTDLRGLEVPPDANILLECLGNLTANELYSSQGGGSDAVLAGVDHLLSRCAHLTVVTNEVCSGGTDYAGDALTYMKELARINRSLAARADCVVEVVCGLPNVWKGGAGMSVLRSIAAAFAMFSAFPVSEVEWSRENLRWLLCAFPLVGVIVGLLCWGWAVLTEYLRFPDLLRGAGLTLIPVLATGGIHLDGYADTWDALSSCAPPEKKREILADPRLGAFAAIHLCGWFVADFALWTALPRYEPFPVLLGFCLSRSLSGLAVASFPLAKDTGLAHTFAQAADQKRTRLFLTGLSVLLCIGLCVQGWQGAAMAAAALGVFCYYRSMSGRQFGGLSGDLAGWFLQTAELWMLGALVLGQYVEGIL